MLLKYLKHGTQYFASCWSIMKAQIQSDIFRYACITKFFLEYYYYFNKSQVYHSKLRNCKTITLSLLVAMKITGHGCLQQKVAFRLEGQRKDCNIKALSILAHRRSLGRILTPSGQYWRGESIQMKKSSNHASHSMRNFPITRIHLHIWM